MSLMQNDPRLKLLGTDGILMPTVQSFFAATELALETMPQQEPHFYLAGKGWGAEIALLGEIEGKQKNKIDFGYRSHSDFELYATRQNFEYTEPFQNIFGAQEVYPVHKTKGLKNLPDTLLRQTAETVSLNGLEIKIPQLELLFLDKWIVPGTHSRTFNGNPLTDAVALATAYLLDRELAHHYLEEYFIKPEIAKTVDPAVILSGQVGGITRLLKQAERNFAEEGKSPSTQELVSFVNEKMDAVKRTTKSEVSMSGTSTQFWIPIVAEDVDANTMKIKSLAYEDRLLQKIKDVQQQQHDMLNRRHSDLDQAFSQADSILAQHSPMHSAAKDAVGKITKTAGIAGIAVAVAEGDIVSATMGAAMEGANSSVGEKALGLAAKALKIGGFVGKRIPVIGAAVTAGFVLWETGSYAFKGELNKAGAAFMAGAAETAGNIIGFGLGDAAREGTRGIIIASGGDKYAEIDKSGIREVAEGVYRVATEAYNSDFVQHGGLKASVLKGEKLATEFQSAALVADDAQQSPPKKLEIAERVSANPIKPA